MAEQKSEPATHSTATGLRPINGHSNQRHVVANYLIVWVDAKVTTMNADTQHALQELRSVINKVKLFSEPDECVTFLQGIRLEKIFLIVSDSLAEGLVPRIHSMTQIDAIYVFCDDESQHTEWVKTWSKVKGVYTQIEPICQVLELAVKQDNQDSITMSFAPMRGEEVTDINLHQLFKNTLLAIKHDRKRSVHNLVKHCEKVCCGNSDQLRLVEKFGRDYHPNQAIWWYTQGGFIYQMLNRALRLLQAEIIVKMGFFIHDLHQQIQRLYNRQVGGYDGKAFRVYREQVLSMSAFEKLKKTRGGLISFNGFLLSSTAKERTIVRAESAAIDNDQVGVVFVITIDPNVESTPFADVQKVSSHRKEPKILFSTHTVFRIGTIRSSSESGRHFEISLTFITDDDTQLCSLMEYSDHEIRASSGWERLGSILMKVGQPGAAEELYRTLLKQTADRLAQGRYYHQLGIIKKQQGDYKGALSYCEKNLVIKEKRLRANDPSLAASYNDIGSLYHSLGEYSKALSFYEKDLAISQQSLPPNPLTSATSYGNIGSVYKSMGDYSKALAFYERALEIKQESLLGNHPSLAVSFNNMGSVYRNMGEYSKALSFYEQALEIKQESLPANDLSLAHSYNNIGLVYFKMGEYSKALSFCERALEIKQKGLPTNHPDLAHSYNNIGSVQRNMGEYEKALSSHERALGIKQKSLPPNHPDLAASYNNIGLVYENMREYSQALSFYGKDLAISQQSLPYNHPDLAASYNNIGSVYRNMGEYSKALSFYEQALEIRHQSLPPNHPDLAVSFNNMGSVYRNMGEYSKALSFYQQALEIGLETLPTNHPHLFRIRENLQSLIMNMNKS